MGLSSDRLAKRVSICKIIRAAGRQETAFSRLVVAVVVVVVVAPRACPATSAGHAQLASQQLGGE